MTRPSIERPILIVSGEIEPLAKAKMPPATPQTVPAKSEGEPVHPFHVDADRLRPQRRVAAGAHGVAERREQNAPQQQNAEDDKHKREQKECGKPVERNARPDAEHAIRAARKLLPLEHDRPDDLREGERQHGEIDAGETDRRTSRTATRPAPPRPEPRRERGPSARRAISPPGRRHRRRGRNRRRGRTSAMPPGPMMKCRLVANKPRSAHRCRAPAHRVERAPDSGNTISTRRTRHARTTTVERPDGSALPPAAAPRAA